MKGGLKRRWGYRSNRSNLTPDKWPRRAVLMYVLVLAIIRLGKKRSLGRATAFDVILTIMIGSVAGRALTGGAPFFPSVAAMLVLVLVHWVISLITRNAAPLSALVKGHSTILVKNGRVIDRNLSSAHMSRDDLDEDLRQKGIQAPAEVSEARLERSGELSVIKR